MKMSKAGTFEKSFCQNVSWIAQLFIVALTKPFVFFFKKLVTEFHGIKATLQIKLNRKTRELKTG